MGTTLKTRKIQLNLNFFWESENININPSGWVLLESTLNNEEISDKEITLSYIDSTHSSQSFQWKPNNFPAKFEPTKKPEQSLYLFKLKYEPENFNGVYSQYLEQFSEESYYKINIGNIKTINSNEIYDLEKNTITTDNVTVTLEQLINKQFTYKPYYDKSKSQYQENEYQFKTGTFQNNNLDLKLDKTNITDQLLVQLLKTPVLKNITMEVPLKEQVINDKTYKCNSGLIWKYKIAPIMPYGILESLAVEGEIDLLNIGIFQQKLNKFKYYNTEFQSQLLLDITSYNSQGNTVDSLKLSFYDIHGKVCDYILPKMTSYNGQFKITVPLDGILHDGMYADENYPNYFSNNSNIEGDSAILKRLPDKDLFIKDNSYVEKLNHSSSAEKGQMIYAYHDKSLSEGLHPNYLYWVKISYNLEENPEVFTEFPEGFWYWTNSKYNEYYYNDNYNNYNDIPFDLDLIVKASISGNSPEISTEEFQSGDDVLTIYKEKNKKGLPFIISIYPDFNNYYSTLRVNVNDTSSFLKSISYGINSEKSEWDRSLSSVVVADDIYDAEEYSHVIWDIQNTFATENSNIEYYPSYGNTDELESFEGKKIFNLKDVKYNDLNLKFTEDIQRTFLHQLVTANKKIAYHPVVKSTINTKYIKSGAYLRDKNNMPVTILYHRNSEGEINSLDEKFQNAGWGVGDCPADLTSQDRNNAVLYFNMKNTSQQFHGAWFIQKGGTSIKNSSIFGSNQLTYIHVYGLVGDTLNVKLINSTNGWEKVDSAVSWDAWIGCRPYMWKEKDHKGITAGVTNGDYNSYLCYVFNDSLYVFKDKNIPEYLKTGVSYYGINEQEQFIGSAEGVPIEYRQNEGSLINKQDLVIQIEGKENPDIYLLPYNINRPINIELWKNIEGSSKDSKCITFKYNGIAQTVQNLSIKLNYPQKYLDEMDYYKDPDTEKILPYSGYTVFYKKDNQNIPIYNASYDPSKKFNFKLLTNDSTSYNNDQGDVFMYYCIQGHDKNVRHLGEKSEWGNAMSGMLVIPYKNLITDGQ